MSRNNFPFRFCLKEIDKALVSPIARIILRNGVWYFEHKFSSVVDAVSRETGLTIQHEELYKVIFPDLKPSRNKIASILDNAALSDKNFEPLFEDSETVYRVWIQRFFEGPLAMRHGDWFELRKEACIDTLVQFRAWTALIIELGKSSSDSRLKMTNWIAPTHIAEWLANFGVNVSDTTAAYLLESGFPYCGHTIPPRHLFEFTGNGRGIIGLLAFELSSLVESSKRQSLGCKEHHPLKQSVVLALARLEHYLNPSIK